MNFWKKTFPFILLNIVVSAATMLFVLWLWQKQGSSPQVALPPQPAATTSVNLVGSTAETPPANPDDEPVNHGLLSIDGVFGAGDINVEYILIRNQSDQSVNLNTWSVASDKDKIFTLPYLVLNKNGAVRLYSKHGTNSVIELYWNSDTPLWTSGDEVYLIDGTGRQQATWQVP